MWWVVAFLCLSAAWWAPAGSAAQDSSVLRDARLAPVRAQLARSVAGARGEGLPAEWLLDKVAEGLSKRVPPPLIARAVDALLERMRVADRLVAGVPGARGREQRRLLRAAVDALSAGAPRDRLEVLIREVGRDDPAGAIGRTIQALTTVAELAERDFSGAAAVESSLAAFRSGGPRGLSGLLRRARQIGPDPAGGRDVALRQLGRDVGRPTIDPSLQQRDHDRDVDRPGRSR
jgi:hypothetical protein